MLTNRQILSKVNESGGGVSFAELGAELPTEMHCSGTEYKYGGETLSDYEITHRISKCGCQHDDKLEEGGFLPIDIPQRRIEDMWLLIDLQKKKAKKLPTQYDINLIKNAFFNKVKKLPIVEATVILDYLTDLEKTADVKPIFSKNHKIWENYIPQTKAENTDRKPLFQEGSYVKYSTGDVDIENWVGIVTEINDFRDTYGYRINSYTTNLQNPMSDSEHTNEVYESSLKQATKSDFEKAKQAYEKYKNLHHAKSPITELTISSDNNLSKQLIEHTGDQWNSIDFENIEPIPGDISFTRPFFHKKTGQKFVVLPNLPSTEISAYSNPYEINRAIERFLDDTDNDFEFTPEQKEFISHYSGYGGLEKFGSFSDNELKGLLYEYFTRMKL